MRLLMVGLWIGFVFFPLHSFTDTRDTIAPTKECALLQKQLDSVNAKLDKIMLYLGNEGVQTIIKRQTVNWGKGICLGGEITTLMVGVECGYTYKTRKGVFWGAYLGIDGRYTGKEVPRSFGYLKIMVATPVFLNGISLGLNLLPIYYLDKDPFFGDSGYPLAIGLNPQISFWLAPKNSLSIGFRATNVFRKNIDPITGISNQMWGDIKMGYSYTF